MTRQQKANKFIALSEEFNKIRYGQSNVDIMQLVSLATRAQAIQQDIYQLCITPLTEEIKPNVRVEICVKSY